MKASRSIANLAQTDAPAKLFIEKGVITEVAFPAKIAGERATSREKSSRFDWTRRFQLGGESVDSQRLERFERLKRLERSMSLSR